METPSNSTLPVGVVTFLFTDIESSTRLIEQFGESFHAQLEEHNQLLAGAIEDNDGEVVGTEGDSFFAVFPNPIDSVTASAEAQRLLAAHDWPEGGEIKVRMGIHTGIGVRGGDNYLGIDVHRAARIAACGWGGQILLSDATAALVGGRIPESTELRDLGKHRLKDLSEPEAIFQLTLLGLEQGFPPLRTLDAVPNNLPLQLTTFIGRERLVAEISEMVRHGRILTLTGPGGTGKTRLSLQVGADLSQEFADGVFFVPLASVTEPDLVASEILECLGVAIKNMTPEQRLMSEIADKELLLIADNFEQVIDAAPLMARLAMAAPGSKFLTTSRSPLSVGGEQEIPIPPLDTPSAEHLADPDRLFEIEAVHLFVDRAILVDPSFELTAANARHIAALVDRVDGLPLAIELLASRVKLLPPGEILERFEARTISSSRRDLPERQRSVWGAIDWSHQLLSESERKLFRRLAVFVGGARLEEIELVCSNGEDSGLLDDLSALVDHSLVRSQRDEPGVRFAMLHVIKEYAIERFRESDETDIYSSRHATAYLELAERAAGQILGRDRKTWLSMLDREHDNLRAALSTRYQAGDAESAMRLVHATWRFMQARGHLHEATMRIDEVLAMSDEPTPYRAKALEAAGGIAWWRGDLEQSTLWYREATEICRTLDDPEELANSLYNYALAGAFGEMLDQQPAQEMLDQALDIYEKTANQAGLGDVHWGKANLELNRGDAKPSLVKSHLEAAASFYKEAGNDFGYGWSIFELGEHARRAGNLELAEAQLREGLHLFDDHGDLSGVVLFLSSLAAAAFAAGNLQRAYRLAGAVQTLRLRTGTDLVIAAPNLVEGLEPETLEALPGETSAPYHLGKEMSVAEAVEYALD